MTRDEAMDMLKYQSDMAELLSTLPYEGRIVVLINPCTGYSAIMTEMFAERWIAAGWEPVAEFENGKQVEVHRFHLHLK